MLRYKLDYRSLGESLILFWSDLCKLFGSTVEIVHYETCPEMELVRHFRYAQFRPDYKRGVMNALTNNRITSHFEANTAKLICNNCFILL